jgi:hypothetical protein
MSGADERVALRNLKTAWKGAAPENGDYGEAVAELNSSQMDRWWVKEASLSGAVTCRHSYGVFQTPSVLVSE